jgi:dihydrofolate reductase
LSTIAINTFLSLDGVAQAPGGTDEDTDAGFTQGGWTVPHFTEQVGEIIGPWHTGAAAFLLGRRTYDIFAGFWPNVPDDHADAPMAKILNETPKYVASTTLRDPGWEHTTVLDGDVVTEVKALKEQVSGEIQVIGSIKLAQTLIEHDLIDEFRLTVFPVVLGTGKRLFGDGAVPTGLKLESARSTDSGVVACVYRHAGRPTYGSFGA